MSKIINPYNLKSGDIILTDYYKKPYVFNEPIDIYYCYVHELGEPNCLFTMRYSSFTNYLGIIKPITTINKSKVHKQVQQLLFPKKGEVCN